MIEKDKDWIPLEYMVQKIKERKFTWTADFTLKYMEIRLDARDDRTILLNRHGKIVASTKEELDELFARLDGYAEKHFIFDRRTR